MIYSPPALSTDEPGRRRRRAPVSAPVLAVLLAALEFAAPRASLALTAQQQPAPPQQPMVLSAERGFGTPAAVLENAPVFLLPDATRLPLRIAQAGSQVRVIQQTRDWSTVQF